LHHASIGKKGKSFAAKDALNEGLDPILVHLQSAHSAGLIAQPPAPVNMSRRDLRGGVFAASVSTPLLAHQVTAKYVFMYFCNIGSIVVGVRFSSVMDISSNCEQVFVL